MSALTLAAALLLSQPTGFGGLPPSAGPSDMGKRPVSADGRYVAFASTGDGLSPDDDDAVSNVYLRDRVARTTTLVSRDLPEGATSSAPSVSGDGTKVAFVAGSPERKGNRGRVGTYLAAEVYVRDLAAGTTTLVSRASGDGDAANLDAGEPVISTDGKFVAFSTEATNLGETVTAPQVWRRALTGARATVLVSRAAAVGNYASYGPDISADGGRVAFHSLASNLGGSDGNNVFDVYLRDVGAGTTTRVSPPGGAAVGPSLSATGDRVAFVRDEKVYLRRIGAGDPTTLVAPGDSPSLSADATRIAFGSGPEVRSGPIGGSFPVVAAGGLPALSPDGSAVAFVSGDDALRDDDPVDFDSVYVATAGAPDLVSRPTGDGAWRGPVNDAQPLERGAISADGGVVVFASASDGLSDADDDTVVNVFARDTRTGVTRLLSPGVHEDALNPIVSADGSRAAFRVAHDLLVVDVADPHPARLATVPLFDSPLSGDDALSRITYRDADQDIRIVEVGGTDRLAADVDGGITQSLSGDGNKLAYGTATGIAVKDLATGTMTPLAGGYDPVLDRTGAHVAFTTNEGVVVRDLAAGTERTLPADEPYGVVLSADGGTVAFGTEQGPSFVRHLADADAVELPFAEALDLDAAGGCVAVTGVVGDFAQILRYDVGGPCPGYEPPPAPTASPTPTITATATPTSSPSPAPTPVRDTTAPRLSHVSLRPRRFRRRTTLRLRVSERARLVIRIGRRSRRVTLRAGAARLTIRRGNLKRGRHTVRLRAFDAAGNASRVRTLRVRVRAARR